MDFDLDEIAADATLQLLHTGRAVHGTSACKLYLHSVHAAWFEGDSFCVCMKSVAMFGRGRGSLLP
jgi:hypothetical protein